MSDINMTTLSNGMRLVTVDMPSLNSVTVLAMVGVGSRYEDSKQAGISHFLEHLPFKGTKNYPSSLALAAAIDGVGGKHNAFTGKEYTGYWVKVGADKLRLALDVVSDLVLTAKLDPNDIDMERGVIIEELNMYEDQPQAKVADVYEDIVYTGSPLSRPVIGYKDTVGALRREDFLAHWDKWYDPKHVVIGIVGRVPDDTRLQEMVEEYFAKGSPRQGGGAHVDVPLKQNGKQVKVEHRKTEQAHFLLGFPGLKRLDPDRYAAIVLQILAGGNSSSRFFNEIREKRGLAYYAYAALDMNRDAGTFYAYEGVKLEKAEEAIKVTLEEFGKLGDQISDDEVNRAKEYITGKLMLDLEDSSRMADMVVERALFENEVVPVDEVLRRYRSVTPEQVRAVAKRMIDFEKVNLAIIGPYEESQFEFVRGH